MEGPGSVAVDRILLMKKTTTLHEASSLFKTINRSLNIRKRYKQSVIPVAHHPMYDNLLTGEKQNQIAYGDQFKSYFYTEITGIKMFSYQNSYYALVKLNYFFFIIQQV